MKKRIKVFFIVFALFGLFLTTNFAYAQDFGINEVNTGIDGALSSGEDVRVIAGRFIQFALGFLGVLAVLLIMYAGFLWMTSGGNEEKISVAKKILKNGIIGLIIILSAWTLATFFINRISGIVGQGVGSGYQSGTTTGFYNPGAGAIGNCAIENIYPNDGQKDVARNTSILVTFKEELDLSSVCVDDSGNSCECDNESCNKANPRVFRLFTRDLGDACGVSSCPAVNTNVTDILVSVASGNKILVLTPREYLGSSTGHTPYNFKISGDLRKEDGASMFFRCAVSNLEVGFTVSDVLDLSPPFIERSRVYPVPDNERDSQGDVVPAENASAEMEIVACPQAYSSARILAVSPNADVTLDYKGSVNKFVVTVPADSSTKAQLFNGINNSLLGITDWNAESEAVFEGFLTIKVDSYQAGNRWEIDIVPEKLADTFRINNQVYTFSDSTVNNSIEVISNCNSSSQTDLNSQAEIIQAVISGHPDVSSELDGSTIKLEAKIAGTSGNNIALSSTGTNYVSIRPFSGGVNRSSTNEIRDKKDVPRNSAIQFTFNEAINPMTVVGSADEVSNYVRVVNNSATALAAGLVCNTNSDCLSYNCDNSICVGSYLNGNFRISNNYRSVEFLTNNECGVNGCGETIYCLPGNSNLKVEIMAADLRQCENTVDCAALSPFTSCSSSGLAYNTCQNPDAKNYPMANIANLNGVVDAAANSFDGNRSGYSQGPLSTYYENTADLDKGDNYSWSFFVSDYIDLNPPKITSINPTQGQKDVALADPIVVNFDKLMLASTLTSGSVDIFNGRDTFNHKFINLKSAAPSPFGFWVISENIDIEPFDGEPDLTRVKIEHSPFTQAMTFMTQVGSGVKDINQNCYKPSVGPGCPNTDASCCYGSSTFELDAQGNCIF